MKKLSNNKIAKHFEKNLMSWVTFLLSVAMMLLMVYMLFQIIREVLMINRFVDKVRKERTEKFSSETEKTLVEEMGK